MLTETKSLQNQVLLSIKAFTRPCPQADRGGDDARRRQCGGRRGPEHGCCDKQSSQFHGDFLLMSRERRSETSVPKGVVALAEGCRCLADARRAAPVCHSKPMLAASLCAQVKSCRARCGKTTRRANQQNPSSVHCENIPLSPSGKSVILIRARLRPIERGGAHVTDAR